jgi:hypothetical protein
MYKKSFLRAVNFKNITKTMHIDGHLLFAAGKLNKSVRSVPIFKRYKNYPALSPTARISYVFDVLMLMPKFHFISIQQQEIQAPKPTEKPVERHAAIKSPPEMLL